MTDVSDDSLPEWTEDELAVLRTADDDHPPARSLAATLAAVGAGGAVASGAAAAKGASVAATAKWTSAAFLSKWVGVLALGGVVVTGGVVLVRRTAEDHGPSVTSKAAPGSAGHEAERAPAVVVPPAEPAVPAAPSAASGEATEAEAAPAAASAVGRSPAVKSQPDISLEIAALDGARTALRAGRSAEALSALDRYDAKFARAGSLRLEATELRIEALLRSGNRARATSLANVFLARNPKSPYAARVRALIGASPASR